MGWAMLERLKAKRQRLKPHDRNSLTIQNTRSHLVNAQGAAADLWAGLDGKG
jgi:hypothetical protein